MQKVGETDGFMLAALIAEAEGFMSSAAMENAMPEPTLEMQLSTSD